MQSISVFLDIAKFAGFRWKYADASFFGLGITVPSFIIVRYVWQILGMVGIFVPPPSASSPEEAHPE